MEWNFSQSWWAAEDLGKPIPDSDHALSVCLPLWRHNIGYEESDPDVLNRMQAGYQRFFLNRIVRRLFAEAERRFAKAGQSCYVFPSERVAERCAAFVRREASFGPEAVSVHDFGERGLHAVCFPESARKEIEAYWRHTGEIVSSRLAQVVLGEAAAAPDAGEAAAAVRQRVAQFTGARAEDVVLLPTGMAAIFLAYRMFQRRCPDRPSVQFGFPYVDTLKIQQRFSSADKSGDKLCEPVLFYPIGDRHEFRQLSERLGTQQVLGVFCEIPSNPLLRSPDVGALRDLVSRHQTPLLIDDTLGGMTNLRMLPMADVLATSLTKYFSGVGDVMGGALVFNPSSPFYDELKDLLAAEFEDLVFEGDAAVLERNSRDCGSRMTRINHNAETLAEFLSEHRAVTRVYYPKYETPENYITFRQPGAGYGGLLSFDVVEPAANAPAVFDALRVAKGPNLGTNYTLSCPYTILAHSHELDFAERCGVSRYLIRVSVGLEATDEIITRFREALGHAKT